MTTGATTVADDEAVIFDEGVPHRYQGLTPDTVYDLDGVEVRTLPRPGELLATREAGHQKSRGTRTTNRATPVSSGGTETCCAPGCSSQSRGRRRPTSAAMGRRP